MRMDAVSRHYDQHHSVTESLHDTSQRAERVVMVALVSLLIPLPVTCRRKPDRKRVPVPGSLGSALIAGIIDRTA